MLPVSPLLRYVFTAASVAYVPESVCPSAAVPLTVYCANVPIPEVTPSFVPCVPLSAK